MWTSWLGMLLLSAIGMGLIGDWYVSTGVIFLIVGAEVWFNRDERNKCK